MELSRHNRLDDAGTDPYTGIRSGQTRCSCGWESDRLASPRWPVETDAQFTAHLADVGALTSAGRRLGMAEAEAEAAADNLTRH